MIETPQQAARRLAHGAIRDGFQPQALHAYTDANGQPLHWRIRLKNTDTGEKWIRPMKWDGNIYTMGEPDYPDGKPLYLLYDLAARTDEQVEIVEGELCVDALSKVGVLATTSGAADSAVKADWGPLAARSVRIWPDNDEAGHRYAEAVAEALLALGCTVRKVDVAALNLPTKGDAVDWLTANPNATALDIAALPTLDLSSSIADDPVGTTVTDTPDEDEGGNQSQASALVAFVEAQVELFHDQNSEVFAQDLITRETRRLDSRQFRDWLVANFYQTTGKSPRDQSVREALSTLSGLGRFNGECRAVHVRVGQQDDAYFLDLGEPGQSRVVRIEAGRWEIVSDAPVRFIRPETLRPLPIPLHGGDLNVLWRSVNIPEDARLLVLAWLCECLRPDTPFPVLELIGEQGSAKSTTQSMLRRIFDPNACDLRAAPKTVEDVFVSAGANWLVSYENISHLSAPMQDALCVLATGGGFAKRKLYSDADESVIVVKRPVVLNGISVAVTAQDLIDRTLSVETPVITVREETTDLWRTFNAEHGRLLGALLDVMAAAMARLPDVQLPPAERPRLAEFARFGMAVAEALGKSGSQFMAQFNASRQESIARTIDASPVAVALIDWFDARGKRTATMAIKTMFQEIEAKFRPPGTDAWPRSAKGFADALRRAAPALRQMGIECRSLGKTGSYYQWEIKAREHLPNSCLASLDVFPEVEEEQDIKTSKTSSGEFSTALPPWEVF
jgi:hypothetical protein